MTIVICTAKFEFYTLGLRNENLSLGIWVNLPHLVLFLWTLIALKDILRAFKEVGWYVCWGIRLTVNKTLPRHHHGTASKQAVIWDNRLNYACDWVDDSVMDRILQKEEDTRMFRLARRILRKRRG